MNKSILSLTLSEIISLKPLYKLQPFYFINNPLLFFGLILWVCMVALTKFSFATE